jgi:hypothetical protein
MTGSDLVVHRIQAGARRAKDIADIAGWNASKISRIEHAVDPSHDDVQTYLAAVETFHERVASLATFATNATSERGAA